METLDNIVLFEDGDRFRLMFVFDSSSRVICIKRGYCRKDILNLMKDILGEAEEIEQPDKDVEPPKYDLVAEG